MIESVLLFLAIALAVVFVYSLGKLAWIWMQTRERDNYWRF